MKNVAFLISDMKNTLSSAYRFVLDISNEMYKSNIKIIIFSQNFSADIPSYVKRRKINIIRNKVSLKIVSNKIAKEMDSIDALIAIDFPMNIIASMVKNIVLLKSNGKINIHTVWYLFSFHSYLYSFNMKANFLNDALINLDIKHTKNIDLVKTSSKKIEEAISFINTDIKSIETIYPSYKNLNTGSENYDNKKYFVLFGKDDYNTTLKCIVSYAMYLKESSNSRCRLKVVGYHSIIKNQISLLKIDKYVEFIQINTYDETKSIIEGALAIIIYDKIKSFDTNIYLAWSTKTVTIVDIENPLSEIVEDKQDAFLIDIKNPLSLINTFIILSSNKELYNSIAENAYNKLNEKYASENYKKSLICSLSR